jgi:hypothetical protein
VTPNLLANSLTFSQILICSTASRWNLRGYIFFRFTLQLFFSAKCAHRNGLNLRVHSSIGLLSDFSKCLGSSSHDLPTEGVADTKCLR